MLFLFFAVSACEKDEISQSTVPVNNFEVKRISFDDIPNKKNALKTLEKIEMENAMLQGKGVYDSINKFTVHTDEVILITSKETHWLNFYISREPAGEHLENLVLCWNPIYKGYFPFVVQYDLTKQDSLDLRKGNPITDLGTKISVGSLEGKVSHCQEFVHVYAIVDGVIILDGWMWIDVPCGDNGGSGGSGPDGGGGFYPGWGPGGWFVDTNPFSDNNGGIDIPIGSGGGSGGGGGGTGPPNNDSGHTLPPIVVAPVLPEEPEEPDPEEDCNTSKEDLMALFPNANEADMQILADVLNDYGADFGIDTEAELQHFLAQTGHETGGYNTLNVTENLDYSTASLLPIRYSAFTMDAAEANTNLNKYYAPFYTHDSEGVANISMANRLCNGSVASGDGWKYRGRGIMQLTGKCNYTGFDEWYNDKYDPDIDILNNPDVVVGNSDLAILSGMWFFKTKVLDKKDIDENTSADVATKRINSNTPEKSYQQRRNRLSEAKQKIECIE